MTELSTSGELVQGDDEDHGVGGVLECLTALGDGAKLSPMLDAASLGTRELKWRMSDKGNTSDGAMHHNTIIGR